MDGPALRSEEEGWGEGAGLAGNSIEARFPMPRPREHPPLIPAFSSLLKTAHIHVCSPAYPEGEKEKTPSA